MSNRKINIRPSTGVYATYKNIKYDPWTAIAEFVDNSTQSYYDHEKKLSTTKYWDGLHIDIEYDQNDEGYYLSIKDNAYGMNFSDFQRAIILDSPPKKKTRSEFGMGLKTAACWFGIKWRVESTELGSDVKYSATIDVDMLHKYKNEEIEVQEIPCNPKEHGTTITIWNMNRKIVGTQIKKTKDQLRGMYRNDLRSGNITITYNGEALQYIQPAFLSEQLPDNSVKTWKKDISFKIPYNDQILEVTGYVGILEKASTSGAGFALLRHGRVIVGGYENAYRPEEIFGKPNSFAYQRVFGELNMDNWPVTQTKDAFDWYGGSLEDDLIEKLKVSCKDYIIKANTYRANKKANSEDITKAMVDSFQAGGVIENVQVASGPTILIEAQHADATSNDNESETNHQQDVSGVTNVQPDIIIEGDTCKKISFTTSQGSYVFNLQLKNVDPDEAWLVISHVDSNEYDIQWNIRHKFFKPYIDDAEFLTVMQKFVFALALAEIESTSNGSDGLVAPSSIRLRMNDILKHVVDGGE